MYRLPTRDDAPNDTVLVVARTYMYAEVRIVHDGVPAPIGLVRRSEGSWAWEHSDGEQSSPIASTCSAAARALVDYHRKHKPRHRNFPTHDLLRTPVLVR